MPRARIPPLPPRFSSITTRLIAWSLLACGGVYLATGVVSNALARRMTLAAAERETTSRAEAAAGRIEGLLTSIEERTRMLGEEAAHGGSAAEALRPLVRRFLERSPEIHRVTLGTTGFDRNSEAGEIVARPEVSGEGGWSEPHQDPGGPWLVTFAAPVGGAGKPLDVVAADVSLEWLDGVAGSLGSDGGFGVILSRSGRLLAHPRRGVVDAGRPVLDELPAEPRARLEPIVRQMLSGERGFLPVDVQGETYRLTYRPVGRAGWSLGVLHPEAELLADVRRLRLIQASLGLTGLVLLGAVVVLVSRRVTRPVKALAAAAEQIATGDLDAPLPPAESQDEVGGLARAFHHMRDALKEHIRALQETTAAKERFESELKIARRIQADMLPRPHAGGVGEGYELAATLVPARAVGGDLFDHFRAGPRIFFLVGDVSGKGVGAALFMARAKTLFETVAAREGDPGVILSALNRGLSADNDAGMYVTAVLGALDVDSGELSFAAAGHEPPVLIPRDGPPAPVQAEGGPVVGLLDAAAYPVNRLQLAPGEAVVLYTDGVSDARNTADELFEAQRLIATLGSLGHEGVDAITQGLLAAVRAFAGEAPQSDDITILTLRYLARG